MQRTCCGVCAVFLLQLEAFSFSCCVSLGMLFGAGVCIESCAYADIACALLSGNDNAEDVSLVDIRQRLQSLIAQLDNLAALAMEQHRAEPGLSNMDMHADDSAQRRSCSSEIANTHDDVDKLYVSGTQRLASLAQHCTPWHSIALLENAELMPVSTAQHSTAAQHSH